MPAHQGQQYKKSSVLTPGPKASDIQLYRLMPGAALFTLWSAGRVDVQAWSGLETLER